MKKNTTQQRLKRKSIRGMEGVTIGVDLGDKTSRYCVINDHGEVVSEGSVATIRTAMREKFGGLGPCRADSGEHRPQLPITKEGDVYLRALLVQGAHCILSRQGPDTDLKRWGTRIASNGGKNAKKASNCRCSAEAGGIIASTLDDR